MSSTYFIVFFILAAATLWSSVDGQNTPAVDIKIEAPQKPKSE
jgi:hypothetical protein